MRHQRRDKVGRSQIPSMSSMNSPSRIWSQLGYGFTRYGNPDMVKPDTEKPAELNIEKSNTENQLLMDQVLIPFLQKQGGAGPPERKGRDAMSGHRDRKLSGVDFENIEYDYLCRELPPIEDLDEIGADGGNSLCPDAKPPVSLAATFPMRWCAPFFEAGQRNIRFVMDSLQKNTTEVRNMK